MAKSRRVKHSKKSTRRAGAVKKPVPPKFSSVADACRKILKARTAANAEKFHAEALTIFPAISEVEKSSLDLCLSAVITPELKGDAEAAIADLESAPSRSSTPETIETELKTVSPTSSQEDIMMMDIDREPSPGLYRPFEVREGGPMELDGGRKRRKTRRGGRKHKSTRRH
jgi:hypothetical protein